MGTCSVPSSTDKDTRHSMTESFARCHTLPRCKCRDPQGEPDWWFRNEVQGRHGSCPHLHSQPILGVRLPGRDQEAGLKGLGTTLECGGDLDTWAGGQDKVLHQKLGSLLRV